MLFTPTAGVPDFSRDDPVLFFDHGTRSGIAIEAPEDIARHSAIGTQRAVFVNHIEKREFNARCRLACHFAFPVIVQHCHASSTASPSSSHGRQDQINGKDGQNSNACTYIESQSNKST